MCAVIEAWQALRGVAKITVVNIVAEVGSLSRFEKPRQLMGYSGLLSSEFSSGNRIQRGGMTKAGNAHLASCDSGSGFGPTSIAPGLEARC